MRARSSKQAAIERKLSLVYEEMDVHEDPKCKGCGRWQGSVVLSRAHIISRRSCKDIGKPELIYLPENIVYLCMDLGEHDGCHNIWDDGTIEEKIKLDNFEEMMGIVKKYHFELFTKISLKVEEVDEELYKRLIA